MSFDPREFEPTNRADVRQHPDGSLVFSGYEGSSIIKYPDGTRISEQFGSIRNQTGGSWPDTEFAELLPRPNFHLVSVYEDKFMLTAEFDCATIDDIKPYIEELKAKGFVNDSTIIDREEIAIYSYSAKSDDGHEVIIGLSDSKTHLKLTKSDFAS